MEDHMSVLLVSDCDVCGGETPDSLLHGHAMHSGCAPKQWRVDQGEHDEFMRRFRMWWKAAPPWQREWDGHSNCECR